MKITAPPGQCRHNPVCTAYMLAPACICGADLEKQCAEPKNGDVRSCTRCQMRWGYRDQMWAPMPGAERPKLELVR